MKLYRPRATAWLSLVIADASKELVRAFIPPGWHGSFPPSFIENAVDRVPVTPRSMTVRRNSYYEADDIDLELDYSVFPFDPRLAENVRIEAWMANAAAMDETAGPGNGTLLFLGHADDGEWEAGGSNSIRLRGRDHTALLADTPWSGERIKRELPVDAEIRKLLDRQPATAPLQIEVRGLEGPVPNAFEDRGDIGGNTYSAQPSESTWDLIVGLAAEVGLVTWIEGDRLILAPGQVATEISGPLFIYGQNLRRVAVERVWGARRAPVVECVGWDPIAKMTRSARWPEVAPASSTGDGTPRPERAVRYVFNLVTSDAALLRAARNIWRRRSREDVRMTFETDEMTGTAGENLLTLKAGVPVQIYFSQEEKDVLHGASYGDRVRHLQARGYGSDVADAIARGYDDLLKVFQVTEAAHTFTARDGYRLRCTTASYLTAD